MVFNDIADSIWRGVENTQSAVNEALFEPVIRLGVTGLARAGKTVFITSLIANLTGRNRMGHVRAIREGRVLAAYLQPQPDDTVARFDYERHLGALSAPEPQWPQSTRAVSELRLSLRVQPSGLFARLSGPRIIHLDIVDYPGEWLLDLGLLDQGYQTWSGQVLERAASRPFGQKFLTRLRDADPKAAFDEAQAQDLAKQYADYLHAARAAGLSDCTPGRFLLPGDLAGSPVLSFAPMTLDGRPKRGSLGHEMARRFGAYKSQVVQPFFRKHFARIDRQIVLVDMLGAIHAGPEAVEDMRTAMAAILAAFRPGRNPRLARLMRGRRVDRLLFAATRADHLHHRQHPALTAIAEALLADAKARAEFSGAQTAALSLAAIRATVEERRKHDGETLDLVRGTLLDGRNAALFAGALPDDPMLILGPAKQGDKTWLDADYNVMAFAPPRVAVKADSGPTHIRLDRAVEFLLGDRL